MQKQNCFSLWCFVIGALLLFVLGSTETASAQQEKTKIRGAEAQQSGNTVVVNYTLVTNQEKPANISLKVSTDYGDSYDIEPSALEGNVGTIFGTGRGRIVWDVLEDFPNGLESNGVKFKVLAKVRVSSGNDAVGGNKFYNTVSPPIEVNIQPGRNQAPENESVAEKKDTPAEQETPAQKTASAAEAAPAAESPATKQTTPASVVDREIPTTGMSRPDDIAVVIGNRDYKNSDIPDVDYAVRDAQTMKKYLTRTLGFDEKNIIYVENASGAAMERIFGTGDSPKGQLYNWVRPGKSSVFVYYSGHGAPNPESGSTYFIPSNTNPSYLSQNGYPVDQLYENLSVLPAESVTVVLEACFSGTSEGGAVVSDISPAVLSVENPVMGLENGLAFSAGAADQVSTWYNEKKHGLFTYYFLNGLRGEADADGNRAITAKELEAYLSEKVPYRARRMHNREQTPQVVGRAKDRVLVRYEESMPTEETSARLPATTTAVQPSVRKALSLPNGAQKVTEIGDANSLQSGDMILSVEGTGLKTESTLDEIVQRHAPGDELTVRVFRDRAEKTVSVTLSAAQ